MGAVTLTARPSGFLPRRLCDGDRFRTAQRHDPAGFRHIAPADGRPLADRRRGTAVGHQAVRLELGQATAASRRGPQTPPTSFMTQGGQPRCSLMPNGGVMHPYIYAFVCILSIAAAIINCALSSAQGARRTPNVCLRQFSRLFACVCRSCSYGALLLGRRPAHRARRAARQPERCVTLPLMRASGRLSGRSALTDTPPRCAWFRHHRSATRPVPGGPRSRTRSRPRR